MIKGKKMTFTRKDINRNYYTIGEVADIIQITTRTLQRWDKKVFLNSKEVLLIDEFYLKTLLLVI